MGGRGGPCLVYCFFFFIFKLNRFGSVRVGRFRHTKTGNRTGPDIFLNILTGSICFSFFLLTPNIRSSSSSVTVFSTSVWQFMQLILTLNTVFCIIIKSHDRPNLYLTAMWSSIAIALGLEAKPDSNDHYRYWVRQPYQT